MKGEYVEDKDPHHHTTSMFPKFQHHQHHHQPLHPSAAHHFQLTRECQTSEEADSRSPSHITTPSTTNKKEPRSNDGASIEVVRRPRGRPPGSKNKPKPPVIITRESESSMSPYVLELPGGADIIESVTRFCRKRNTGLCVLTGSGSVANVTLRQPSTTPGATVTFHGRFDILSISATILSSMTPASATAPFANGFTISIAGPQGQIVGGSVVAPLLAAGTVYIIAASFNNPLYHRIPAEDDIVRNSNSGGGGNEGRDQSPAAVSGGGDSGRQGSGAAAATGESCGMSIYSCHLPSDVIWAPAARQAP